MVQEFVDLDNTKGIEHVKNSKVSAIFREYHRGLNLEGLCLNKDCDAYDCGEYVIMPWGYETFDFMNDIKSEKMRCPACGDPVRPLTCGFAGTFWRFYGLQEKKMGDAKGNIVRVNRPFYTYQDDSYLHFNE
jgi:hypothetical protein